HIRGMTGLTAYVGLSHIANLEAGDTVFISGAAGAVGTAAGQIAKLMGAKRVIGSAGSAEKVELLTSKYGYDAAFNYKDGDVRGQLAADRKSTRLNSSHVKISYAVFCLKKKKKNTKEKR